MYPVVLPLLAANVLALLDLAPVLRGCLVGAGFGAIAGKALVHRLERRVGELPASRVRQVELVWAGVGVGAGLLMGLAFPVHSGG